MKNLTEALEMTIQDKIDSIHNLIDNGMTIPEAIRLVKSETTLGKKSWEKVINNLFDDPVCEYHGIKTFCKSSIEDENGFTCLECLVNKSIIPNYDGWQHTECL